MSIPGFGVILLIIFLSLSILFSCLRIYRLLLNEVSFVVFDIIIKGMEFCLSVLPCSYDLLFMYSLHSLQHGHGDCGIQIFFLEGRSFITLLKSQLQEGGLLKHLVPNYLSSTVQCCANSTKTEFLLTQTGPVSKLSFKCSSICGHKECSAEVATVSPAESPRGGTS